MLLRRKIKNVDEHAPTTSATATNSQILREIVMLDRSGMLVKSVLKRPDIYYAALSPDGHTIAYSTAANTPLGLYRPGSIWLLGALGGAPFR